ncbi:MAG: NAD(P)-dependent glycerol-3-phosphate dehydrogenase [Woeseia sp.]|nr:NAD(P)-dependent glycerol-3-phosphate dehydrogenase [Woeseia sp.]MBT8096854.1 NAD(P)-dependent glycerol-3-phosphate dehydrogenase [Woeseia sp.]NNE59620.1 NAD(P)-dependent glycerol-3-phosphate dehydrogenase [Woeseia sp.]NNL53880.1 NAD(P)-dependent glycerol-3-phosphate dehydrogenase [Woeseia sp.]
MTPTGTETAICVIGAGSWGTALALQFARRGRDVRLWGRDREQLEAMSQDGENKRYLPGARFPQTLHPRETLEEALQGAGIVLVAVPSHGLRTTLVKIKPLLGKGVGVCWATKGFELSTGKLPHQVVAEVLGDELPLAVLSGPTFAREVGDGLPTAMSIAANSPDFAAELAGALSDETFRAYTSSDIIGVEVGGAVKNVLAIGAGISDGLGFGANTRIAMINRGLVEMTRLGVALGARQETFMGLAGMGDLVLTCTDNLSRNRRMGLLLAAGKSIDEAQHEIQQVVEGVLAAKAVKQVAEKLNVEMPICLEVYGVLHEGRPAAEAVRTLMSRSLKTE